jgi:hypothetical protein
MAFSRLAREDPVIVRLWDVGSGDGTNDLPTSEYYRFDSQISGFRTTTECAVDSRTPSCRGVIQNVSSPKSVKWN